MYRLIFVCTILSIVLPVLADENPNLEAILIQTHSIGKVHKDKWKRIQKRVESSAYDQNTDPTCGELDVLVGTVAKKKHELELAQKEKADKIKLKTLEAELLDLKEKEANVEEAYTARVIQFFRATGKVPALSFMDSKTIGSAFSERLKSINEQCMLNMKDFKHKRLSDVMVYSAPSSKDKENRMALMQQEMRANTCQGKLKACEEGVQKTSISDVPRDKQKAGEKDNMNLNVPDNSVNDN